MSIRLEQLTKRYEERAVVSNLSLDVAAGELRVLLGPSGSGKSTVLRLIAGLTPLDAGVIELEGRDLAGVPARERDLGFVFQNYALFRQMTVAENVEFALRVRSVRRDERRRRRDELLELVGLAGLGGRLPAQLSGGQQQRVALARALAHRPRLLLLDEPFGALDARIRVDLRRALARIQRELRVTTVFVTHDQEEAFELADRIAVLAQGRLIEEGPPDDLYLRPQTEFVATFLGGANLLVGESTERGVRIGALDLPLAGGVAAADAHRRVQVLIRPEDIALATPGSTSPHPVMGEGRVEEIAFVGASERLRVHLPAARGVRVIQPPRAFGDPSLPVDVVRSQHSANSLPLAPGDRVQVGLRRAHALLHPGLSIVLVDDGQAASEPARRYATELARLAQARFESAKGTTLRLAALATRLAREPADLMVGALAERGGANAALELLRAAGSHLLLVRGTRPIPPPRMLIAVAVGEPGKEDVAFAGRVARHLGTAATVLSVLRLDGDDAERRAAERFLGGCVETLEALGVAARFELVRGDLVSVVSQRMQVEHDLLVLGAPLPGAGGALTWGASTRALLDASGDHPILVVRASGTAAETIAEVG
jgi:sulfate/thiosulfate transport system ATP-binding protein